MQHLKKPSTLLVAILATTAWLGSVQAATEVNPKQYHERIIAKIPEPPYSKADVETEIVFGRELASKILGKYPPLKNDKINRYVNEVGQLLAKHSKRPELTYHFIVLDTPIINAFSTPGGYIFITKGALSYVEDEAELAGILAHEIGHVELRHYVKKVGLRAQKGDTEGGLAAILSGGGASAVTAFNQALDETMEILFTKGLQSKKDEFAADEYATWLLANTGYDPTALERYFKRIENVKNDQTEILTETHPPLEERIARLEKMIDEQHLNQQKMTKLEERFHENVQ
jgi:predicted Zn-dependent protease